MVAWRLHPHSPNTRVRSWPVRFENEERFQGFLDDYRRTRLDSYDGGELLPYSLRVEAMTNKSFTDVEEFLSGRSASALTGVSASVRPDGALQDSRSITFTTSGHRLFQMGSRERWFVSYRVENPHEELMDAAEWGTPTERLIEQYTTPMTRWQRMRKVPVIERGDMKTVDQRKRDRRVTLWAWAGSAVVAFIASFIQGWVS